MLDKQETGTRRLVSLRQVAARWQCDRKTVRRIFVRAGVRPLYLGGDARNATLRFDLEDVERVERESQAGASSIEDDNPAKGFGDREERPA